MQHNINDYLHTILSPYISNPQWYPYILIGATILLIILILVIFLYIRSFLSWIFGNSEVARLQKEQNNLLKELIIIQNEQVELMEALFIANSEESSTDTPSSDNTTENTTSCETLPHPACKAENPETKPQTPDVPPPKKHKHHYKNHQNQNNKKSQ